MSDLAVTDIGELVQGQKPLVGVEGEVASVVVGEIPGLAAVAHNKELNKTAQLAAELAAALEEAGRERRAAEEARVEVAKAALRLEAMPRLEADLTKIREILDEERKARVLAEQQAAVAMARLEERGRGI